MPCSKIVCIIATCNYIGKKRPQLPPGYRLISWLFCKLLLCFLGYLSGSLQHGIHYKLHIQIDERYYSKLNFAAIEWITIYNYSFYDVEVSWACAYQLVSFCSWRCCFFSSSGSRHLSDDRFKWELQAHPCWSQHSSRDFTCDVQSVVPYLLPELKWNHQQTVTCYSLFLDGALKWEWRTKKRKEV